MARWNCGCNAQLKGEGTGEDGRQEDSVAANEGPKHGEKYTVRLENSNWDHLGSSDRGRGDVLVDNVGEL